MKTEQIKLKWQKHNRDNGLSWNEIAELVNEVILSKEPHDEPEEEQMIQMHTILKIAGVKSEAIRAMAIDDFKAILSTPPPPSVDEANHTKTAKELVQGIFGDEAANDKEIVAFYAEVNKEALDSLTEVSEVSDIEIYREYHNYIDRMSTPQTRKMAWYQCAKWMQKLKTK